jgi:hypothetical protein
MALFASDYDKSKYLRAEDVKADKKFRIKAVTEEQFDKEGGGREVGAVVQQRRSRVGVEQVE